MKFLPLLFILLTAFASAFGQDKAPVKYDTLTIPFKAWEYRELVDLNARKDSIAQQLDTKIRRIIQAANVNPEGAEVLQFQPGKILVRIKRNKK